MNIKVILNRYIYLMLAIITLSSLVGCQPEDVDNGLSDANVDPSFTITPVQGEPNKFTFTTLTKDAVGSKWDLDDEAGMNFGPFIQTLFFPDAGSYTIQHEVIGRGGIVKSATQSLVVATSDPVSGNILKGGKLVNEADWAQWTITNPSATGSSIVFGNKYALLTANGWAGQGMYQAINVVAGKKYKIDMVTSSTTGCSNTWFEVYCGYAAPVTGTDYSEGGKLRALSTWDGCATAPFSGKISAVGCKPENNLGIFTATTTGTAYLVIRGGGEDMKAGIKIQNIEMRPSL
jgi:hypothetical protein